MVVLGDVVEYLDSLLNIQETPDYPGALNGLQVSSGGPITTVAAAVDASQRTIDGAAQAGASLLLVHHGLFWSGPERIVGRRYNQLKTLISHDLALYSAHLPLDRHPTLGNNVLLARALDLQPTGEFGQFQSITIGVRGTTDVATGELLARATAFAVKQGGDARASEFAPDRRTRSWAICTGGGASADTLNEA